MIDLLLEAKKEVEESAFNPLLPSRIEHYQLRFDAVVSEGEALNPRAVARPGQRGRVKQTTPFNLLSRLRQYRDETLRFILDPQVAFDNNQAERDVRMPKVKQKISGCFRTLKGAQDFCVNRAYLATLRKQGRNLFDALVQTFQANPPDPCPTG
jgi:transposase